MRRIGGLVLGLALLASCAPGRPAPSSSGTPSLTLGSMPSPSGTPALTGGLTFRLTLVGAIDSATDEFGLYLQTDPASTGQTGFDFCAPNLPGDTAGAYRCSARVWQRAFGFPAGTVLVYRFERLVIPSGSTTMPPVEVIASGTHVADGSVIEVTYP